MSSINKSCFLVGNKFERNFSLAINDLLQDEELVDVKLVAEGHLISAHRLVLSAMSPYFRTMFKEMPVNQQTFVFLKDISKQTVIDLITYIYCGEVNVKPECLDAFMNAATALNVKGLADGNFRQLFDSQQPNATPAEPSYNGSINQALKFSHLFESTGLQYQSVQQSAHLANYRPPIIINQEQNGFNFEDNNQMNGDFGANSNLNQNYEDANSANNFSIDDYKDESYNQWDSDVETGLNENNEMNVMATATATVAPSAHKRKKTNNDPSEYNIIADVRDNGKGGQNLFHSNQKFNKHAKANGNGQQRWICTRVKSRNCRAAASTMDINGVMMMKILMAKHTHTD